MRVKKFYYQIKIRRKNEFWSLAGTAISAAISVVSSVCSTLGSFGSSLFKTIEAFLPYLKSIVDVVLWWQIR